MAPADDALAGHEGVEYIIPQDRVELDRLGDRQLTAVRHDAPSRATLLPEDFHFAVTDSVSGMVQNIKVRFRGP